MKKLLFTTIALLAMGVAAYAQTGLVYHEVQVVDEHGRPVTNISTVTIRLSGTTSAATIYKDRAKLNAITQPMTTSSTNTTLSSGTFYWWGADAWDYTIGDGTNTMTNYGHASSTASDGRIVLPTFLSAVSSTAYTDAQSATFGSDSDFVLVGGAVGNRFTVTPAATDETPIWWFGLDTQGMDVEFFAATTGDYILWDASDEQLEAVGASILVDDGSVALGDGDKLLFGDTLGTGDFKISDETDVLTFDVVVAGTGEIAIGNDADDVPLTWYGETTGNYIKMTGDQLQVEGAASGAEIALGDGDAILFGDTLGTGDFKMSDESDVLLIDVVVPGTGAMAIGNDADDVPLTWYGETTGAEVFFTADDIQIDGMSLCIGEGDQIQFGDALGTGDITMSVATNVFTIGQVVAGTGSVVIGVDSAGLDWTFYGDTSSEYLKWATADDTLIGSLGNVSLTTNDAEANQFKVDAVGTVAGIAIQFETTNGGISVLADGAANGDITIDAEDKITIISTDAEAAGVDIEANGGTAETVHIHANQGTSQAAIDILSDVGGTTITSSAVPDGKNALKVSGSIAGATASEGVGLYVEGNISGATDSKVYGMGSWLNITGGIMTDGPDSLIAAADFGLYTDGGPTLTASKIRILNLEYQVNSGDAPELSSMIHFNCAATGDTPDYLFTFGNAAAAVYTENATHTSASTSKLGALKIQILGKTDPMYIYVYSSAGS